MAVDMFFKLTDVKGESKDDKHKGEIDVLAWSWGASNSASFGAGGGGGSGKANFQDLSFTKWVDKASPNLLHHVFSGKHIGEANLVVRKAGDKPVEYLKITLSDVMVTSVSTGGSGGEDRLTENVTLAFAKVKVVYSEQDNKGAAVGNEMAGWDLQKNIKL